MPHRKIEKAIDKVLLQELYVDECLTIAQCAQKLRRSASGIRYYLDKYSIERRASKLPKKMIPRELLEKLYIQQKCTLRECGKYFKVDPVTIRTRLQEYSIPVRSYSQARKLWCAKPEVRQKLSKWAKKGMAKPQQRENIRRVNIGHVPANKGIKSAVRGSNHPQWQGGKTSLTNSIRASVLYAEWRVNVFEKDDFTCQCCHKRGGYLEAHHKVKLAKILKELHITTIDQALVCQALWDVGNGITFCLDCHAKKDKTRLQFLKRDHQFLLPGFDPTPVDMEMPVTISYIAEYVDISTSTIRKWADKGILRTKRNERGHRIFPQPQVTITKIQDILNGNNSADF